MTLAVILVLGLVVGALLGGLGGGGAILTVPALVYVVGQPAQDATTSSLVIVGITALVGVSSYVVSHRVRWSLGLTFGGVGFPATYAGSYLDHRVDENVLLLGFSVLMVVAAIAMVADRAGRSPRPEPRPTRGAHHDAARARVTDSAGNAAVLTRPVASRRTEPLGPAPLAVVSTALAVGLLTGFFGVGGGFVIVPALVLVLRVPIQWAVGTSLMIVALNSATSLVARAGTAHFDWSVIGPFTLAAVVATYAGKRIADRLPARRLKVGFATLLVLVATYTAAQSIHGLVSSSTATTATAPSKVHGRQQVEFRVTLPRPGDHPRPR